MNDITRKKVKRQVVMKKGHILMAFDSYTKNVLLVLNAVALIFGEDWPDTYL